MPTGRASGTGNLQCVSCPFVAHTTAHFMGRSLRNCGCRCSHTGLVIALRDCGLLPHEKGASTGPLFDGFLSPLMRMVCMYECMCIYVGIYVCVHVCMHTCVYVCMYVCMCVYICIYLHTCLYIYVCVFAKKDAFCFCGCICACEWTLVYMWCVWAHVVVVQLFVYMC